MVCYGLLANPPCNIFIAYGDLPARHVWWHQGVPVLLFPAAAPSDWTQRVNLEFWAQGDEERRLNLFFGEDLRQAKALRQKIAIQEAQMPIGSMYGIYANIGGILMVNVTIYSIHGSYGIWI